MLTYLQRKMMERQERANREAEERRRRESAPSTFVTGYGSNNTNYIHDISWYDDTPTRSYSSSSSSSSSDYSSSYSSCDSSSSSSSCD